MTLHFLKDVANDAKSTQKMISTSLSRLKIETMGKLIKRIPGSRDQVGVLLANLPGSASRTHVESLVNPPVVNKLKLISKDT